jgi:hypothetical protein
MCFLFLKCVPYRTGLGLGNSVIDCVFNASQFRASRNSDIVQSTGGTYQLFRQLLSVLYNVYMCFVFLKCVPYRTGLGLGNSVIDCVFNASQFRASRNSVIVQSTGVASHSLYLSLGILFSFLHTYNRYSK